jgi:murein L,D-transpeptidase YcbB/YkuD
MLFHFLPLTRLVFLLTGFGILIYACQSPTERKDMAASANGVAKSDTFLPGKSYSINELLVDILQPLENDSISRIETSVEPFLFSGPALLEVYRTNGFKAIWVNENGLNDKGNVLLSTLASSGQYGLDNRYYGAGNIAAAVENLSKNPESKRLAAEIELSLTNGWLLLALHLYKGVVGNGQLLNHQFGNLSGFFAQKLLQAAASGKTDEALESLQPENIHYRQLQKALAGFYLKKDVLPKGFSIRDHKKDSAGCAQDVMAALYYQGYTDSLVIPTNIYREKLIKFQQDHHLVADGVPGPNTRQLLLLDNREKFRRLALNLERWRSSGWVMPSEYILVNIPGFYCYVIKDGAFIRAHKIIVGKPGTPTPELQSAVDQVVINPEWTVPQSIIRKEMRGKSHAYLSKYNIFQGGQKITPDQINWGAGGIKMVQPPGADNALGYIKFLFPNSYSVYLHDTPSRNLFDTQVRAYSHGCMRMQNPLEMGEFLLKRDGKDISVDSIKSIIATGVTKNFYLKNKMPLFVVYHTVMVDENGILQFYPDIYKKEDLNAAILFYGRYDESVDPSKGKVAIPSIGARPEVVMPEDSLELAGTIIP